MLRTLYEIFSAIYYCYSSFLVFRGCGVEMFGDILWCRSIISRGELNMAAQKWKKAAEKLQLEDFLFLRIISCCLLLLYFFSCA